MEENEAEDKFYYLLDEHLFNKYAFLLKHKQNIEYLKELNEKKLIYSKRYYPINKSEVEEIKDYIKSQYSMGEERKREEEEVQISSNSEANDSSIQSNDNNLPSRQLSSNEPKETAESRLFFSEEAGLPLSGENIAKKKKTADNAKWKPSVWEPYHKYK